MFAQYVSIGLFVAGAVTSVAISAWQYQSSRGSMYIENWHSTFCESWPFEYLRPFSIKYDSLESPSYCGWSVESTGYRIAVAIITLIVSAVVLSKKFEKHPGFHYLMLLINALCWAAVFVVDCTIWTNSSLACNAVEVWKSNHITCNNSAYGITIAVDLIVTVVTFLGWWVISVSGSGSDAGLKSVLLPTQDWTPDSLA